MDKRPNNGAQWRPEWAPVGDALTRGFFGVAPNGARWCPRRSVASDLSKRALSALTGAQNRGASGTGMISRATAAIGATYKKWRS
jgi:hypothetical protein